jgi:hypothetical protein
VNPPLRTPCKFNRKICYNLQQHITNPANARTNLAKNPQPVAASSATFPQRSTPTAKAHSDSHFWEYEQKFLQLLEGVEQGWSRGEIKGFLIGSKINDVEWVNWLQEFG